MSHEVTLLKIAHDLLWSLDCYDHPNPPGGRADRIAHAIQRHWDEISRDAAEHRRVDELHSARDDYHSILLANIELLEKHLALTKVYLQVDDRGVSAIRLTDAAKSLKGALARLKSHYDLLFPRWQTVDDLQQILIEKLSPSSEKLRDLAHRYPPPASWLDETIDPFAD